jgi:integrase
MHPTVIALGFLDHVRQSALRPNDNVFPERRAGGPDQRLGFYITKQLSSYRKAIGIYAKGQDYHALRHTVITALLATGVPGDHVEILVGHRGEGMSAGRYRRGDAVPLRTLYEAICKLDWSDVSPLFASVPVEASITFRAPVGAE